ncbi:MAG: zf-HC2 domain-containing protein [Candidatus Cloacimonetes bacterium]|nr:zf-HC2 domain-containing protein [Candidatus Cloacimonadota bacterium]
MRCEKVKDRLNAYLDKECAAGESTEIRKHLESCIDCQQALRELQQVNSFLGEYQPQEVPQYLNQAILTQIRKSRKVSVFKRFRKTVVALSTAAVMLFGFFLSSTLTFAGSGNPIVADQSYEFNLGQQTYYSYFLGE